MLPSKDIVMKQRTTLLILIATVLAAAMSITAPAPAATRTWIASNGLDTNPCTLAAPCATLQQAYSVTDAGGEINCLDAGSFGNGLEITQSLTVSCETGTAGVASAFFDDFIISTGPSDIVTLRGLDIIGSFVGSASTGIVLNGSGGTVHIEKCLIHGFSSTGILVEQGGKTTLTVTDTTLSDNGTTANGANLLVQTFTGAPLVGVTLKNVQMLGGAAGFSIKNNAVTTVHAIVEDSLADGSTGDGFLASTTGGRVTMLIKHSTASNNALVGIEADGGNTEVHVENSASYSNGAGVVGASGATLVSYGNNQIKLNGHNGTPLSQVTAD